MGRNGNTHSQLLAVDERPVEFFDDVIRVRTTAERGFCRAKRAPIGIVMEDGRGRDPCTPTFFEKLFQVRGMNGLGQIVDDNLASFSSVVTVDIEHFLGALRLGERQEVALRKS